MAAKQAGHVLTKEGSTEYSKGDYLVSNDPSGRDAYAVSQKRFHEMYEAVGCDTSE